MNEAKKTQKRTTIAFSVIITLLVFGFCYLLFTNIGQNSNNYAVKDRVLKITYQNGNKITPLNKLGQKDGLNSPKTSFSVINNGTLAMAYQVILSSPNLEAAAEDIYLSFDGQTAQLLSSFQKDEKGYVIISAVVNATNNEHYFNVYNLQLWLAKTSHLKFMEEIIIDIKSEVCMNLATDLITALNYTYNRDGLELGTDSLAKYIKPTAKNYVIFNDELWRIVGIYKVKTNEDSNAYKRVLIIKDQSFIKLPWLKKNKNIVLKELKNYQANIKPADQQYLDSVIWGNNQEPTYFNLPTTKDYEYSSGWIDSKAGFWTYSIENSKVFAVTKTGIIVPSQDAEINLLPTTYLKATVRIISGDGTISNPYKLA